MRALLEAHGRLPRNQTSQELGRAAAKFLVDMIEGLRAPPEAPPRQSLAHRVLTLSFIQGMKLAKAAMALEISERQLTRERTRAVSLLTERLLAGTAGPSYFPEPIPVLDGFVARPRLTIALQRILEQERAAHVYGPPGIGKTSLVADLAAREGQPYLWWYRLRGGVNDSLEAIILELAQWLGGHGLHELDEYAGRDPSAVDPPVAARIAIRSLAGTSALIVLDGFDVVEGDLRVAGFFEELRARATMVRMVTISRRRPDRATPAMFEVAPLEVPEAADLLARCGVRLPLDVVSKVHLRTQGNPQLLRLAAPWLESLDPAGVDAALRTLTDREEVQTFLLANVAGMMDADDGRILQAAAVFRSRFSDDALAYVAQATRGGVQDASHRLVRSYVATRSKSGEGAFLHTTVRDYVYDRLDAETLTRLHRRAAAWYHLAGDEEETLYHRERAGLENDGTPTRRA